MDGYADRLRTLALTIAVDDARRMEILHEREAARVERINAGKALFDPNCNVDDGLVVARIREADARLRNAAFAQRIIDFDPETMAPLLELQSMLAEVGISVELLNRLAYVSARDDAEERESLVGDDD